MGGSNASRSRYRIKTWEVFNKSADYWLLPLFACAALLRRSLARSTLQTPEDQIALSPQTFNSYVGVVEDFLTWAADEFVSTAMPSTGLREVIETAKESTRRAFRSLRLGGKPTQKTGLVESDLAQLRAIVRPCERGNPFKKSTQFRNYLIVELMLATGIRRGELLKIKLNHLPQGPKTTLTIERSPDDPLDTRSNEPEVKTLGREIPMTKALAKELWTYATTYRRKGGHQYLLVTGAAHHWTQAV